MEEKKLPLVSVVVPCYNHEKYVAQTVENIVNQTYRNIELIVIDDGSKDNSIDVIQKLADQYSFTFLHRANKGLSATLNEGIKLSTGKYFAVCASDDIYMLDKIEKQVKFMEANPTFGMCHGKAIFFENSIESISKKQKRSIKDKIYKKLFYKQYISKRDGWIFDSLLLENSIAALTTFVRKDIFEIVGDFDETLWIEDWDMWLRVAQKFQVGYIDDYLAYYRKHDTNISSQISKMYEAGNQILEKYKENKLYNEAINRRNIRYVNAFVNNDNKRAIQLLPKSIKYYFTNFLLLRGLAKLIFSYIKANKK